MTSYVPESDATAAWVVDHDSRRLIRRVPDVEKPTILMEKYQRMATTLAPLSHYVPDFEVLGMLDFEKKVLTEKDYGGYEDWYCRIGGIDESRDQIAERTRDIDTPYTAPGGNINYSALQAAMSEVVSRDAAAMFFDTRSSCHFPCGNPTCSCASLASHMKKVGFLTELVEEIWPEVFRLVASLNNVTFAVLYDKETNTHTVWMWIGPNKMPSAYRHYTPDEFNEFAARWHEHGRVSTCTFGL